MHSDGVDLTAAAPCGIVEFKARPKILDLVVVVLFLASSVEGITVGSGNPSMNIELWAEVQKISTRYAAMDIGRGAKASIKVQHIEELGASGQPRIIMTGGELDLNGQKMIATNSVGLSLSGGTARI